MTYDIEVNFKEKYCPLLKENCIAEKCAFYDESNAIYEAENPLPEFTFCSVSYLPIVFYELRQLRQGNK